MLKDIFVCFTITLCFVHKKYTDYTLSSLLCSACKIYDFFDFLGVKPKMMSCCSYKILVSIKKIFHNFINKIDFMICISTKTVKDERGKHALQFFTHSYEKRFQFNLYYFELLFK